jgi:hypothetical protein
MSCLTICLELGNLMQDGEKLVIISEVILLIKNYLLQL